MSKHSVLWDAAEVLLLCLDCHGYRACVRFSDAMAGVGAMWGDSVVSIRKST